MVYENGVPAHEVPPLDTVGVMVTVEVTGLDTLMEALKAGIVAVLPLAGARPTEGFIAHTKVAVATLAPSGVAGTGALLQKVLLLMALPTGIGITEIV